MKKRARYRLIYLALMAGVILACSTPAAMAIGSHSIQLHVSSSGGYVSSAAWARSDTTFYNGCATSPWQGGLSYSVQYNGKASSENNFSSDAFSLSFARYKQGTNASYTGKADTLAITVNIRGHVLYGDRSMSGYSASAKVSKDGKSGSFAATGMSNTYRSGSSSKQGKPVSVQGTWRCSALEHGG